MTLGAMMQTAHSRLFADIEKVRDDLSADIEKVRDDLSADIEKVRDDLSAEIGAIDDRLRAVEIDVAAIRTAVIGLDARTGAAKRSRHLDTTETGGREADRRDTAHEAG